MKGGAIPPGADLEVVVVGLITGFPNMLDQMLLLLPVVVVMLVLVEELETMRLMLRERAAV